MNIAFRMMGGRNWSVGPIYLKNLFYALRQHSDKSTRLLLLMQSSSLDEDARRYIDFVKPDEVVMSGTIRHWTAPWVIDRMSKRLLGRDVATERLFKRHHIDAFFGYGIAYRYPGVGTVSYLPDFQYKRLPGMFSKYEAKACHDEFDEIVRHANRIILWTESVRRDFSGFFPRYVGKVRVLRPVTFIPEWIYERDLDVMRKQYRLPEKFIYLPNQFWKHKNHAIVMDAVSVLKRRGLMVYIVCTGNPSDHRHPGYFKELWENVSRLGIQQQFLYLGLIPRDHVLLLIRQSVCLLNPSLFEGWGSTVDEAISVGKRVLLSNIDAHREHEGAKMDFFDPHNKAELTEKLAEIWEKTEPGPDFVLEKLARAILPVRILAYSQSFLSIVDEAACGSGRCI